MCSNIGVVYSVASFPVSASRFFFAGCNFFTTCEKKLGVETGNKANIARRRGGNIGERFIDSG